MNFLAHMYLSCDREALLIGNFIADFVRNRDLDTYPEEVRQGVMLHRRIDSYTDSHPVVLRSVRRLYARHSKYASVIIDVFYDHLLAINWELYSDRSLAGFAEATYRVLEKHADRMPPILQQRLPRMIADNWLIRYAALDGVAFTLERMKNRASKPHLLDDAVESLIRDYDAFNAEFNLFFPDIIAFVNKICT